MTDQRTENDQFGFRSLSRGALEGEALTTHTPMRAGAARAEMLFRDREYAAQIEKERRDWEAQLESWAAAREANRKGFEKAQAERAEDFQSAQTKKLMEHQQQLADKQIKVAVAVQMATFFAAAGAVVQGVMAVATYLK